MKLDVKNLVMAPMGESEDFSIELFNEQIDEDVLAVSIRGDLKLTRLEDEILAKFKGTVKVKTVCDRCAEDFELKNPLNFNQEYLLDRVVDDDEKLSVSKNFEIDFSEPLRQEIMTSLPVKRLCRADCAGLCATCGQNLNEKGCDCNKK